MLNSIAATVGDMGGVGNAFVDNFRTLNAPRLNQNDPQSMREYADWAMRNGDRATAEQYQLAAGKMEQEQGARRAAVDAQGFQQSIRKLEEARAKAINNAGGDEAAIAKINGQYDTAVNAVSGKLNDMSAQYGLDVTGTGTVETERQKRQVIDTLKAELNGATPEEAKKIRVAISGVSSGAISPSDGLEAIGDRGDVTNSWRTAQQYAADYNAANGLKPGDEGYMTDSKAYDITTKNDASRKAEIADASKTAELKATQRAEDINNAYEGIVLSEDNMSLYNEALRLVTEEGADTGRVENMFANLSGERLALENIKNKLGLNIVGAGKFGQLTEKELELALQTGLPDNMQEEDLEEWLRTKIAAETKLMNRYKAYLEYSRKTGGTLADFQMASGGESLGSESFGGDPEKENEPSGPANDGASLSEDTESDSASISLSNGAVARKVS